MRASDIPSKLPLPFGANAAGAYIRTIPTASQIGINDGAASLSDGFVPLNATPISAGGVPPSIRDVNGIFFQVSGWSRWVAAGGPVFYDASFSTAIGGYPSGAFLQSASRPGVFYVSTVDNNTVNPDTGGSWLSVVPTAASVADITTGTDTTRFVTSAGLRGIRASYAEYLAGTDNVKYLTPASIASGAGSDLAVNVQRFPSGLIMQWGHVTGSYAGDAGFTQSFNIPFPNSVRSVSLTCGYDGTSVSNGDLWVQYSPARTNLSQFGFFVQQPPGAGGHVMTSFDWLALGT